MMGHMYKRINALENRDLFAIEKKEHHLKRTPTVGQLLRMEMEEHKLKNLPTLSQVKKAEAKEHAEDDDNEYERKDENGGGVEDLVIEGTSRNRRAANSVYRRKG
jgi:FtsZ-binding cell division protein ZapB